MTIKQWLWRYQNESHRIDLKLHEYEETYERLTKITAVLDKDAVSSTKDPHKFDELAELSLAIRQYVAHSMEIQTEISQAIDQLEDWRHRDILTYRYINGYTWDQVADTVYLSRRHVTRLHGDALNALRVVVADKLK